MKTHWLRGAALLALALTGCGRGLPDVQDTPQDNETSLGEKIAIDLEAWLAGAEVKALEPAE